ncbi:MAG: hypothetical protein ACFNXY_11295 [Corynebacterium matruchotii]|uniref:hypothetical protein n=1 Tax=Corynebacterium matruchotii TaxID=43768 RepID=UPI00361F2131
MRTRIRMNEFNLIRFLPPTFHGQHSCHMAVTSPAVTLLHTPMNYPRFPLIRGRKQS